MAMYYQSSSEIQADGLQTLYLVNPNFAHYSDAQNNALFLNPAAVTTHAPPHHNQHFVGVPLSHDPNRPPPVLEIPAAQSSVQRHHYHSWNSTDQSASGNNHDQPNIPLQTPRGLSLSLSAHHQTAAGIISPPSEKESNGVNTIIVSKYLKAAQELLDEVVIVGNESKAAAPPDAAAAAAAAREKAKAIKEANESGYRTAISAAQRHEMQMKKAKLNSMLDEVEQRCRQYHHQMHVIVTTFEQAAGVGSARAYTHLALKTILKQFRCLKSTIASQIKGLSRTLGEEESAENKIEGSRLKFVDTQLRQARGMQHMGMMQGNAWRPQRGLPEKAVSVLRAWLFEHFLHPYPKDSDKQMLAKQTGLTRSQVSNWFINARVRLWKPMVEKMYVEETNTQDPIPDPSIKPEPDNHPPGSAPSPPPPSTLTASPPGFSLPPRTNFAQLITSLNQKNPKKPITAADIPPEITAGGGDQKNYLSTADANLNRYGFGEFGADQHLAAAGFHGNAALSLSLSLPPAEQQFLSHRGFELGTQIESGAVEGNRMNEGFEMIDFQNRKPFPAQLLPDFVA